MLVEFWAGSSWSPLTCSYEAVANSSGMNRHTASSGVHITKPSCLLMAYVSDDRDDVTATQLAVDRQIEHGEVPSAPFDLEFRPNRPDVFGAQRRLCSGHLALVPGHSLKGRGGRVHLILHGHTPRLQGGEEPLPLARALESGLLSDHYRPGVRLGYKRPVAMDP